jgi:hypothetical protein
VNSLFIKLIPIFILVSCSNNEPPRYIDGDDLIPPEPPFWEYFTVHGYDVDGDMVRDDLELWINKEFDDPNIRKAMKWRMGLIYHFSKSQSTEGAMSALIEMNLADACLAFVSDYKYSYENHPNMYLYTKFYNNFWRRRNDRMVSRKYVPSHSMGNPFQNRITQMNTCRFEVQDMPKILKSYYESGSYRENTSPELRKKYIELVESLNPPLPPPGNE